MAFMLGIYCFFETLWQAEAKRGGGEGAEEDAELDFESMER
jgi:hypothetical protein